MVTIYLLAVSSRTIFISRICVDEGRTKLTSSRQVKNAGMSIITSIQQLFMGGCSEL